MVSILIAKMRSAFWLVGFLYQLGGSVSFGCSPGIPGSSSSPAGNSKKLASSLTDSIRGKCQGTCAVLRSAGFTFSVRILTPADSNTLNALIMLFSRMNAPSPDIPMRIAAWNVCCSAFSRTVLRLSAEAFWASPSKICSHVAFGSTRLAGTGEGA